MEMKHCKFKVFLICFDVFLTDKETHEHWCTQTLTHSFIRSFVSLSVKIVWCYIAGWRSVSQSVTSQKWLTVAIWLSWMTFRNDCLKWLSGMTVLNDFHDDCQGWLSWILHIDQLWTDRWTDGRTDIPTIFI